MTRTPLILDGLNLNDGTVYAWLPGAELGARQKTWTERKSYTGAVAQYNVSDAASIPMKFPMLVQGVSLADLDARVQAINTKIDGCSSDSPKNLVFAGKTYQIVTTSRVAYVLDEAACAIFWATFDLVLNRTLDEPSVVFDTFDEYVSAGYLDRIVPSLDIGYRTFDAHGRAFVGPAKNYVTNPACAGAVTGGTTPAGYNLGGDMVTPLTVTRVPGTLGEYAYHVTGTTEAGKTWNLCPVYLIDASDWSAGDGIATAFTVSGSQIPADLKVWENAFNSAWGGVGGTAVDAVDGQRCAAVATVIPDGVPAYLQAGIGSLATWAASAPVDFYFEEVQVEKSLFPTHYFDGDSPGCEWTGTVRASTSTRDGAYLAFAHGDLLPDLSRGTVYMQAAFLHGTSGGTWRETLFHLGEGDTNALELVWWQDDTLLLMANATTPHVAGSGIPAAALTPFPIVARWDTSELRLAVSGVETSGAHALNFHGDSVSPRYIGAPFEYLPPAGAYLGYVLASPVKKSAAWMQAISADGGVTDPMTLWNTFMEPGDVIVPLQNDTFAYRKANRPAASAAPVFLLLGDSLTMGLFASSEAATYRSLLKQRFGASGDRIQGNSGGGSYDFLTQETEITAAAPDVLILELGTNDDGHAGSTPWTLAKNLRTLIGWTRAGNPQCRVVVLGEWGKNSSTTGWDAEIERVANDYGGNFVSLDAMSEVAANKGPADLPTIWHGIDDGHGGYLTDNFHPNDTGHAAIYAAVAAVIEGLL